MTKPQGSMSCGFASHYSQSSRATSSDPEEVTFKDSQRDPSTSLRMTAFYAAAYEPIRRRNSGRHALFRRRNFRKRCIRTNRYKLRRLATIRFYIARTLFAFPAPWCQYSNGGYPFKNYRRNCNAQNEFNHYACVARRNLPNHGKS